MAGGWQDASPGFGAPTTPAEQEAERRYQEIDAQYENSGVNWSWEDAAQAFEAGAEWSESRYRELLEAAREYRDGKVGSLGRLLAAADALEEAEEDGG